MDFAFSFVLLYYCIVINPPKEGFLMKEILGKISMGPVECQDPDTNPDREPTWYIR